MSETDKARGVNLALLEAFTDMLEVPRWLVWSWVKRGARWTKVPHIPGTIVHARVNDARGVSYAEARAAVTTDSQPAAGVGWRLLDDIGRVWIDLDKCRDPVTGATAPWAAVLLAWAPEAYREVTPSGRGWRIMGRLFDVDPTTGEAWAAFQDQVPMHDLLLGADPAELEGLGGSREAEADAAFEVFHAAARYVTVSGWDGRGRGDVDLSGLVGGLRRLARDHGGRPGRAGQRAGFDADGAKVPLETLRGPIEDVAACLELLPNADLHWNGWIAVGLAAWGATGGSEEGFAAFEAWSEKSGKYLPDDCRKQWEHFAESPPAFAGIESLAARVRAEVDRDWKPPSRRAEMEFDVVDLPPGPPEAPVTPDGGDGGKRKRGISVAQTEVADAFEQTYRGRLRFDHTRGTWFVWDGTRWKREATRLAFHWASRLARRLASSLGAGAAEAGKASFAAGVERLAQARRVFAVTHEVWDADPWLLGTPGGVVELRTGVMRPVAPEDHITRQTAVAPTEAVACPLWLKFLDEATGKDADMIAFLQRWFGYCLTGDTSEHALVFVHGDGGNGKGVMINTVFGIMADYVANAVMDTFVVTRGDRHSTDLAMLDGARLVVATEVESGQTWAEARMKAVTGGDPITARFMRQDNFTFTPRFKLTISGNHKPALRGVDHSTRRRFNIVPFTRRPAEPDRTLTEKLVAERPAILRWMIDGCVAWQRDGLGAPAAVTAATAGYFDAQDYFGRWIGERCLLGENLMERPIALLRDFQAWCRDNGENVTDNRWLRGMLENTRGVRYVKTDGIQGVRGIGLKPVSTAENGGVTSF